MQALAILDMAFPKIKIITTVRSASVSYIVNCTKYLMCSGILFEYVNVNVSYRYILNMFDAILKCYDKFFISREHEKFHCILTILESP